MRALLRAVIIGNPAVVAEIPENRWIQAGSVDRPPARPFGIIRIVDGQSSISGSVQPTVQIWIHDERGSYTRIDRILGLVKDTILGATPVESATERIAVAEWTSDSPDFVDEGYNTNTRYSNYTLTGRK